MTPHARFVKLITGFIGSEPYDYGHLIDNEFMLNADGPVLLKLDPERAEITFSTLIFCAGGEPELIDPEAIAEFNAYHVFHGGYRLSVDVETECLYIAQTKALTRLESAGLGEFFEDFVAHCCSCTNWYMAEILEVDGGASESEPVDLGFSI